MKILLGVGGSDDSLTALSHVVDRADRAGDELTIAILENPDTTMTAAEIENRVTEMLDTVDITANIRHLSGDPGSQLVDTAEEEGFDAIALGGGQESPMGKIRPGHIAEFVILNARTTVMLIR